MSNVKCVLANEALRSQAIGAAYQNLGTPFVNPSRIYKIANETNGAITISFDGGTTDHEHLAANAFLLIDATSNRVDTSELCRPVGTQVAVKGAGAGTVYLSTYYAA